MTWTYMNLLGDSHRVEIADGVLAKKIKLDNKLFVVDKL